MVPTKHHQIIQTRLPPIRPVLYMMSIHIPRLTAPGEAAGLVPDGQSTVDGGRHRAAAAPDIEYPALLVFKHGDDAGIA